MSNITIPYGTGFQFIGPGIADDFSVVQSVMRTTSGGGGTTTTTEKDTTYSMLQGTSQTNSIVFGTYNNPTLTNLTPENGTLLDDVLSPVGAGGACVISAYKAGIGTRHYTANSSMVETDSYQYTPVSFTAGSVMRHVYDTLVAAMVAYPALTGLSHRRFNVTDAPVGSPSGTLNTAMWMYSRCDLSCVGYSRQVTDPLNPTNTQNYVLPATLLYDGTAASKFAGIATHVSGGSLPAGSKVNFMRQDGTFATMTTAAAPLVISGDLSLIMFTTAVTGIEGAKTLGADYLSKIPVWGPKINSSYGVPALALFVGGQWATSPYPTFSTSNVRICGSLFGAGGNPLPVGYAALAAQFNSRSWSVNVGDSSGPTGLPINGKFVVLGTQYQASGGPSVVTNRELITAGMNTLAGTPANTYVMGVADLSGFTTY